MAASISPSVIMTQISSYINTNETSDALFTTQNAYHAIDTYKWVIGTAIFVLVTSIQLIKYFVLKDRPPPGLKLLPGPMSTIPYIGRIHDVDPMAPWYAMKKFSDKYNGIYKSTICGEMHIWIGDANIAYDLLCKKARIYSSRPMVPAVPGSDSQGQYLPLLAHDGKFLTIRHVIDQKLIFLRTLAQPAQVRPHCPDCWFQLQVLWIC